MIIKETGYKILKFFLAPLIRLYYRPIIINKEVIPKDGPIIVVGNHRHTFDQFLAIISTKRVLHYMAKKEYFDGTESLFGKYTKLNCRISKWIVENAGCISVDRSKKDTIASEHAIYVLENGGAVGLFPEGTRNKTDALLLPFKFGAVSMAEKTNATIVPYGRTGEFKFWKRPKIEFGTPFKVGKMTLEEANEILRKEIEILITK